MKTKPFAESARIFEEQDIPHAPSQWTEDLLDDPQVRHEGLVIQVNDPVVGLMEQMGAPITFEDAPYEPPGPAPLPGQDGRSVCSELGMADDEIAEMLRSGALT